MFEHKWGASEVFGGRGQPLGPAGHEVSLAEGNCTDNLHTLSALDKIHVWKLGAF